MNGSSSHLRRSVLNRQIAGVCGGLAEYFGLDATLVRVVFAVLTVFGVGSPILVYIVLWVVIPEREYY